MTTKQGDILIPVQPVYITVKQAVIILAALETLESEMPTGSFIDMDGENPLRGEDSLVGVDEIKATMQLFAPFMKE